MTVFFMIEVNLGEVEIVWFFDYQLSSAFIGKCFHIS